MKVYLVGRTYDDFCGVGFIIYVIASTPEKAKALKYHYLDEEDIEEEENEHRTFDKIEIREWEVDVVDAVGEIIEGKWTIREEEFKGKTVRPYKIIK